MAHDLRELIGPYANVSALARSCGISPQGLHQVLRGEFTPSEAIQGALAKALGVPVSKVRAAIAESRRRAGR